MEEEGKRGKETYNTGREYIVKKRNVYKNTYPYFLGFSQLKTQHMYTQLSFYPSSLLVLIFFGSLLVFLQSHCHCHVQHGPQPLPSGHPDLLAGDREL